MLGGLFELTRTDWQPEYLFIPVAAARKTTNLGASSLLASLFIVRSTKTNFKRRVSAWWLQAVAEQALAKPSMVDNFLRDRYKLGINVLLKVQSLTR